MTLTQRGEIVREETLDIVAGVVWSVWAGAKDVLIVLALLKFLYG